MEIWKLNNADIGKRTIRLWADGSFIVMNVA
jgi:hypothetical protein